MKKTLLTALLLASATIAGAQQANDPVIMTVNGVDVPRSEFEYSYNKNNTEWVNEKLGVGDIVYRNYDGRTNQEGAYVQGELSLLDRKLTLVLSGALSNTGYQRVDYFYYDKDNGKSKTYNFLGGTAKFGANYNIDRHNNVFFNVGYISRAPYFAKGVFLSQATSNAANPDPLNEKVFSAEIGYGFSSRMFSATLNGYYTKWLDKTTTKTGTIGQGPERYYMNMGGVDARHMGIEFNCTFIPVKGIELTGMVSLGDYIWDSNALGYYYNENGQPLANTTTGAIASGIAESLSSLNCLSVCASSPRLTVARQRE